MSALAEKLLTADEFEIELGLDSAVELIEGRIVLRAMATRGHSDTQDRVRALLSELLNAETVVRIEVSFRPGKGQNQLRADIGVYERSSWEQIPKKKIAHVPAMVVEVLSPSDKLARSNRRRQLCLENGCREYWNIDPDLETVEVATDDRTRTIYHCGESIPLTAFPGTAVSVDSIFE